MGCGASAKPGAKGTACEDCQDAPKPKDAATTATAPAAKAQPKAQPKQETTATTSAAPNEASGAEEAPFGAVASTASERAARRPSFACDVEKDADRHEGHGLAKDVDDKDNPEYSTPPQKRRSTMRTSMELWWMDSIPELYGVEPDASDTLRKELQEVSQAIKVKKCMNAKAEDIPGILKEWLHDCPNTSARDAFIERVITEVGITTLQKSAKSALAAKDAEGKSEKQVTILDGVVDGANGANPKEKVQRRGTGFVTASQVRALMASNYSDSEDEEDSNDEQDDEEFERELQANLSRQTCVRVAVASETHEVPADWKPPIYKKTDAQRSHLIEAVSASFMFAALGYEQLQNVIDSFEEVQVEVGTNVIEEGAQVGPEDRGLYVLDSGELDVYKKGKEGVVFTYNVMGQYFGDLALLYNAPRSATVTCTTPAVLWSMDRTTFNYLVKDEVQKAKERRIEFLNSVEILKGLNAEEVARIGDSLRERSFGSGVHIIQEGTKGDVFYILEKGSAAAIKDGQRVMEYKPADYFGELALLKDAPRAADVVTLEDCIVLSLDRKAFERLMGRLDTLMKQREEEYAQKS